MPEIGCLSGHQRYGRLARQGAEGEAHLDIEIDGRGGMGEVADGEILSDRQFEIAERDKALAECIGGLPEVYQSALRLYYWLGAGVGEVAALLDVPENTAKSYLHRARQLLHGMLKEKGLSCE